MQTNEGATAAVQGRELLTFTLGSEEYGIDILKVQEIRGYDAVTTIANSPAFIKGVINLRGIIVPIVDMRIKFNLGKVDYDQFTVVIILNLANRVMGIVVDGVSDVITLTPEPQTRTQFGTSLIRAHHGPGYGGRTHDHRDGYRKTHDQQRHGTG
jgi:purine-binding chemotaxis protein CheW